MPTYKQPEKEKSRELIWMHAVESLTLHRDHNRILNTNYMNHLWSYCQNILHEELDADVYSKWKEYADICYGQKKPEELKVAFFCGSEPENDVRHLLSLGIRIENIYAFECDKGLFVEAVKSLHDTYPLLKIHKGKIESFAELHNTKFDIVYLDFTGSLLKEYKAVFKLFDSNAFSDMSILAINTTYPDIDDENVATLANFFFYDTFFESSVLYGVEKQREPGDTWFYRAESCSAYGIYDIRVLQSAIKDNFDFAYSAFQTALILDYANKHKASYEVFKRQTLSERLIKNAMLVDYKQFEKDFYNILLKSYFEDGRPLPSCQYNDVGFVNVKEPENKFSRHECMKISEIFIESPYKHFIENYSDFESWSSKSEEEESEDFMLNDVSFKEILTDEVKDIVDNIGKTFHGKFKFCDMPMEHLWLELLMFQLGHPYHTNTENHRRYSYTAKTRKMCIDIFTLDKCRAFYDWMPMLDYFLYDMKNHNRQMLARMCIDAIDKHLLHIVDEVYFGAALVGINEYEWSKNHVIQDRISINDLLVAALSK